MYQVDSWNNQEKEFVIQKETDSYFDAFEKFRELCKESEKSAESKAVRLLIKSPKEVIRWWTNRPNEFN